MSETAPFFARIVVLPPEVQRRIAAGEVVERPVSVVKELVENALDAGADDITVLIDDGGRRLIEVRDNGRGMAATDARLALERHATSKISTDADLFDLHTFGFRGEALPSIAAVSRFSLVTREPSAVAGTRVTVDDAGAVTAAPAGAPPGTTVTVRDLFHNVPARLKFLRAVNTERGMIVDCLNRFSLAAPECGFTLMHNGRRMLRRPPADDLSRRLAEIIGRDLADRLAPVSGGAKGIAVTGFITRPHSSTANRKSLYLFVNRRMVRDKLLAQAVMKAFGGLLERGRHPAGVLFVEADPAVVDVNVHPAKEEVRFAHAGTVFNALQRAITDALSGYGQPVPGSAGGVPTDPFASFTGAAAGSAAGVSLRPSVSSSVPGTATAEPPLGAAVCRQDDAHDGETAAVPGGGLFGDRCFDTGRGSGASGLRCATGTAGGAGGPGGNRNRGSWTGAGSARTSTPVTRSAALHRWDTDRPFPPPAGVPAVVSATGGRPVFAACRVLGQLWRSYILLEHDRRLLIIDQHAAHERILYDELKTTLAGGRPAQSLLLPVPLTLNPRVMAMAEEYRAAIEELGFTFEEIGPGEVLVTAMPAISMPAEPGRLFQDTVADLEAGSGRAELPLLDDLAARLACRLAVKANDTLDEVEIGRLLERLDRVTVGYTCPHGRPLLAEMSRDEIEKLVHRR
ncbi:MAG: DNA mismatch repair endonuclease MutL [Deltaproteobacteria bacterium]|nr:DNA mismatch repair endonuclease MutL [Candidatus Anaeroferrophillacea bacterium]